MDVTEAAEFFHSKNIIQQLEHDLVMNWINTRAEPAIKLALTKIRDLKKFKFICLFTLRPESRQPGKEGMVFPGYKTEERVFVKENTLIYGGNDSICKCNFNLWNGLRTNLLPDYFRKAGWNCKVSSSFFYFAAQNRNFLSSSFIVGSLFGLVITIVSEILQTTIASPSL